MADDPSDSSVSRRDWISLAAVLFVQAQNAFNDNFVRFVLMGLAMAVAAGTAVGSNIEFVLAAMITVPFIVLAPLAGYFSDRFSKRDVIRSCLILQLLLFGFVAAAVAMRSVRLALLGFFLLAIQSTLFSPAKQGILKEIVGSRRLGFANGLLSMLTMAGILGGMWLGGSSFDALLANFNEIRGEDADNAWRAALIPVLWAGAACLLAIALGFFIRKTPDHPGEPFSRGVFVRHFRHLKELFQQPLLRSIALFIAGYWLVANFMGLGYVQFAKELFPDASKAGRMEATATMLLATGIGLIVGSLCVSLVSLALSQLKNTSGRVVAPVGGIGMALGLVGAGFFPPEGGWWYASLGFIGFSSGFYVVPLNAWLQDLARESHRARVISALNLMNSMSGILAILLGMVLTSKELDLTASQQVMTFAPFVVVLAFLLARLLKTAPTGT